MSGPADQGRVIADWVERWPGVSRAALEYATANGPGVLWALLDGTIHEGGDRVFPGPWCVDCPHTRSGAPEGSSPLLGWRVPLRRF